MPVSFVTYVCQRGFERHSVTYLLLGRVDVSAELEGDVRGETYIGVHRPAVIRVQVILPAG